MNPQRYFMTNMAMNPMMIRNGYGMARGTGLIRKIMQGFRSFNWSGLLNGANKTLNVMNQTIPLIKEAKPMVGNVRNMIKLAKAFGSETNKQHSVSRINQTQYKKQKIVKNTNQQETSNHGIGNDYPTFFV